MPVILNPSNGGDQVTLDKPIMVIGRHPDCDIVLHNSRKVSRKHCCLAFVNDRYLVRDLNSMNGIRINGETVEREQYLEIGDLLQVGDVDFTLMDTNRNRQPARNPAAHPPTLMPGSKPEIAQANSQPVEASPAPLPIPDNYSQEVPVVIPESEDLDEVEKPFSQAEEPPHPPELFEDGDPTESSDSMNDADSQVEMAY